MVQQSFSLPSADHCRNKSAGQRVSRLLTGNGRGPFHREAIRRCNRQFRDIAAALPECQDACRFGGLARWIW